MSTALAFPCTVSIDTAAHLTGGPAFWGDDVDELAREIAMAPTELADVCRVSTGLRIAVCEIALSSVADRFGAIVEAIKEHAADELGRRLESEAEAHA